MSSGGTASRLADELAAAGHELTWLGAKDAIRPTRVNRMVSYYSFSDLEDRLRELLGSGDYDIVIHAAAVSDFSVASVEADNGDTLQNRQGKLSSGSDLLLRLKRNPKLLNQLKTWSANPDLQVIGFKLTDTDDLQQRFTAVKKQFDDSKVDAVVHNDLSDISREAHPFSLYTPEHEPVHCADGGALAKTLDELMETV
jgi:phosphopantothenoylcysteine decarboxylase/phosphopantothenate--cysteine ligase